MLGPEVLVYMAFVSVAGFAQPSYELGYAFKLLRVALLLLTAPSTSGDSAWGSWASWSCWPPQNPWWVTGISIP